MKFGFITDPISHFDPQAETTSFIIHECIRRGYECWVIGLEDLFTSGSEVFATAKRVETRYAYVETRHCLVSTDPVKKFSYKILSKKIINLKKLDVIFLRKDPPVDQKYIDHLTMLELLTVGAKDFLPLLINSPTGIKKANEKIYPFYFKGVSPPSMVSCSLPILLKFVKKYKTTIVKPLNQSGGRGISLIRWNDSSKEKILKKVTHNFSQYVLIQKFIPQAKKGDKRILLWNGKILGSFLRVPAKGDFRGNMHAGATWVKSKVNNHELKLIKRLIPQLRRDGLTFVGLDVIGPYITEINVTSPMGIREINELEGKKVEKRIVTDIILTLSKDQKEEY